MKNPAFAPVGRPDPVDFAAATRLTKTCARHAYDACPNDPAARALAMILTLILTMLVYLLTPAEGARAQQPGLMSNGDIAVTGFSGTAILGGQPFIDTGGASLKVLDLSAKGEARGQLVSTPTRFEAYARDIGQVFGIALDNAPNPNIYTTSTVAHGLRVVIPDNNGDGVPEVVQTGQPGAAFMEGQFGAGLGGGPGTVWRIDGTTGDITKFADIASGGVPNSGPGLGNITFDPAHYQFYVSDMDTGKIHRLDLSGNDIGSFDHGTEGRPQTGLAPVGLNPAGVMDITSPAFDTANPGTWGLADERRRVWGLAYHSGRLYYAVVSGSQIWSVGINTDGSFAGDARVEIEAVEGGKPVSDILFTTQGRMVVAQRGGIQNQADHSLYHVPLDNRVLRYGRDASGIWVQQPDEYAIGFPPGHRNASGGVGLACDGTLWSSGDALRNDPALAGLDPLVVHGLQGNDISYVRPINVPPQLSWFADYDGEFNDPEKAGHIGDVEVYRNCTGGQAESWPGWYPVPEWYPPLGWEPPVWWPREPDLDIEKFAQECKFVPALNVVECKYTIVVTNVGAADYVGHLHVVDNPPATAVFIPPPGGTIPWTCVQPGGAGTAITCDSDNVETLHPGELETLEITIQVTPADDDKFIHNCATVEDPFDFWPNVDCDWSKLPRPDLEIKKVFSNCVPDGINQRCFFFITLENVGGAPYTGELQFEEHVPAGTIFGGIFGSTTPGWGCIGGAPITCTLPDPPGVTMNPGDVEVVGISVIVPPAAAGDMENCVNLGNVVHPDDPAFPGNNENCVPFTAPAPPPPPPFKHACPAGWQEVPPGGAPAGWQVIALDGVNPDGSKWGMMCMRPAPQEKAPATAHNCPAGWSKVPTQGAPAGWKVIVVDGVNPDGTKWGIKCMKPKPKEETLPVPQCFKHERNFASSNLVPRGWTWRKVTSGNATVICAMPGLTTPDPVAPKCVAGERQVANPGAAPSGWTVRTVTSGKHTIFCAKPGSLVPVKPRCDGGKLVLLKTAPPRWSCICPARTTLKNGKCVSTAVTNPQSTPQVTVPPVIACPKGWSKISGKCVPPKPPVKPCPRGWSRIKGKCVPPAPQVTPQIKKPLILKPKIKPKPQTRKKQPTAVALPKKTTGKVMLLSPGAASSGASSSQRR